MAYVDRTHAAPACYLARITAENIRLQVKGVRVIPLMQRDRRAVVVLGDGHCAAQAFLQAGTTTTTAAEVVNDDFIVLGGEGELILRVEMNGVNRIADSAEGRAA